MEALLSQYKQKRPEIVFEWSDPETEARGWVVINSLRNGAAGGGTRMRKGLTKEEVISLAKVMEIKFSVCGPPIGGAKSGIDFDPRDPRKNGVLKRWYRAIMPLLKNYYGTGGDLNVDEIRDVIPITESLGLWHPQEGVVNGHLQLSSGDQVHIIGQLRYGCAKAVEDPRYIFGQRKQAVADMITGYGVAESVRHFYDLYRQEDLQGKRVIVQGWGNVASAAALYLTQQGAVVVGIIDKDCGIIDPRGMDFEVITGLFNSKDGNKLNSNLAQPFAEINANLWDIPCEVFVPGAASKIVTRDQVDRLMQHGLEVIACGANVPFVDDTVFFGPTALYADQHINLIPDFISNSGMARVFAYLMQSHKVGITDHALFEDVSLTIRRALQAVRDQRNEEKMLSTTALQLALERIL